jgi:hypothetical protein
MEELQTHRRRDDFIDIIRRELNQQPLSVTDLAKDDLLDVVSDMQFVSAGRRRRFRDGLSRIAAERGFDSTVRASRQLVALWRERADELEIIFHYIIDSVSKMKIHAIETEPLPVRSKKAREQMQAALRGATDNPSHRVTELRLAIELCVKTFGYDASFIEANRLTNDLRSDANDLESALCDIMFDDFCSRESLHGQTAAFARAA